MFAHVAKVGECVWFGLSSETKPTPVDGHTFFELDTCRSFVANGSAFVFAPSTGGSTTQFLRGDGTWASPGGGAAWGGITGTLSGQTDLQSALNGKQAAGSYASASHGHAIGDTTGLQAALDGKQASGSYAPLSHTHAIADVTNLQSTLDAKAVPAAIPNASYRSLLDCTASHIAARVAGTYWFGQGQAAGITGTGTLYAPNLIYIDSADYPTLNGVAPKLRIRAQIYVNDTAPTGNFTLGLYPVTRPGTSGGAGLNIFTLGTVVAGSQPSALVTPAADSMNIIVGADFALPANGHYVLGMVTTATVATASHLHISALLQMRNA